MNTHNNTKSSMCYLFYMMRNKCPKIWNKTPNSNKKLISNPEKHCGRLYCIHSNAERQSDFANLQDVEACGQKNEQNLALVMVTSSATRLERCDMNTNTDAPVLFSGAHMRPKQHGMWLHLEIPTFVVLMQLNVKL